MYVKAWIKLASSVRPENLVDIIHDTDGSLSISRITVSRGVLHTMRYYRVQMAHPQILSRIWFWYLSRIAAITSLRLTSPHQTMSWSHCKNAIGECEIRWIIWSTFRDLLDLLRTGVAIVIVCHHPGVECFGRYHTLVLVSFPGLPPFQRDLAVCLAWTVAA